MRWALWPVRLMQRIGLGGLIRWSGKLLPGGLRRMQEIVPTLEPHYGSLPEVLPAEGKRRARVALFLGCAADAFYPQTNLATARVLQRNGCEVWIPRGQGCCGALHVHSGLVAEGQAFAAENCTIFGKELDSVDAIINNAGGCGPVLKEYGHLLENTPSASVATKLAHKVRDISEFLMQLGPIKPEHPVPLRATYHDACGLAHGQKIRQPPRQLLGLIPELKMVPLVDADTCCGAAGSYNITQPEMAAQVGKRKANHILATGAQALFTGNVGCLLQIARHLRDERPNLWVAHPIEALWASYTGVLSPAAQRALKSPIEPPAP
jgi:glycolate oxidase iron-sulfur subunit